MTSLERRVPGTGSWSFVIGPEFDVVDNGDSVQGVHGKRVVYVSSHRVETGGESVSASQLRSTVARRLGVERLSHVGSSVGGDAEVRREKKVWRLFGTMCAAGTVATCVIDFEDVGDQSWAASVWRSLLCDEGAG